MPTLNKFQDLVVWQLAKEMSVVTYRTFYTIDNRFSSTLINQIIRSVVSIPSNIAEGSEREGN
jgi:four helix bundle protein